MLSSKGHRLRHGQVSRQQVVVHQQAHSLQLRPRLGPTPRILQTTGGVKLQQKDPCTEQGCACWAAVLQQVTTLPHL